MHFPKPQISSSHAVVQQLLARHNIFLNHTHIENICIYKSQKIKLMLTYIPKITFTRIHLSLDSH